MMKNYVVTEWGVKGDSTKLQTKEIQAVLDLCKSEGGTVIFPEGVYHTAGLYVYSNTTVYLKSGAIVSGCEDCNEYKVFPFPKNEKMYTDPMLFKYLDGVTAKPERDEYRRAIFSSYAESNIAFYGEQGSLIDGNDCFDENGEEGFRGPHGIWMSSCTDIRLEGYETANTGAFHHQLDNCSNVYVKNVRTTAGHDGFHIHLCKNIHFDDCIMETGDDCIAGVNVENMTVENCYLNTSCSIFRLGGKNIVIRRCRMQGYGRYVHRYSIIKGKNNILPIDKGRRNTFFVYQFFASELMPMECGAKNILIEDCSIDYVDGFLFYLYDSRANLHTGTVFSEITLKNVQITNLQVPSIVSAAKENPLHINLENVYVSGRNNMDVLLVNETENVLVNCKSGAVEE